MEDNFDKQRNAPGNQKQSDAEKCSEGKSSAPLPNGRSKSTEEKHHVRVSSYRLDDASFDFELAKPKLLRVDELIRAVDTAWGLPRSSLHLFHINANADCAVALENPFANATDPYKDSTISKVEHCLETNQASNDTCESRPRDNIIVLRPGAHFPGSRVLDSGEIEDRGTKLTAWIKFSNIGGIAHRAVDFFYVIAVETQIQGGRTWTLCKQCKVDQGSIFTYARFGRSLATSQMVVLAVKRGLRNEVLVSQRFKVRGQDAFTPRKTACRSERGCAASKSPAAGSETCEARSPSSSESSRTAHEQNNTVSNAGMTVTAGEAKKVVSKVKTMRCMSLWCS